MTGMRGARPSRTWLLLALMFLLVVRLEAHVQQGQYASLDALTADIERYAR